MTKPYMLFTLLSLVFLNACKPDNSIEVTVNWERFLSRQDLYWNRMPDTWEESPFLGNGMMGSMIYMTGDRTVRWDIGRGDAQDHRPGGGMYNTCRLPIGYFILNTVGKITGGEMKLDLWNAEVSGIIETDKGSIRWRSIIHAEKMVLIAILEPTEGEQDCQWEWNSQKAISPRQASGREMEGYVENPPAESKIENNVNVCIQPLLIGGETTTAWTVNQYEGKSILVASVAHSYPEIIARQEAVDFVKQASDQTIEELFKAHQTWWHAYYPKSFISIPDTEWESFYWIQMYKLASATRADRMLIDNQGPWLQPTPLSGAQCIHDMILQSWGGTIRIFPAAPDTWQDIVFHDMRAEGAFLVSAVRKNGKTQCVRIKSLAGEPCRIKAGLVGNTRVTSKRNLNLLEAEPGLFILDMKMGDEAIIWSGNRMSEMTISSLPADTGKCNSFGLN